MCGVSARHVNKLSCIIQPSRDPAAVLEAVKVCDRLAYGHDAVTVIDPVAEQDGIDFGGETRRFAEVFQAVECLFVMIDQLVESLMGAAKR